MTTYILSEIYMERDHTFGDYKTVENKGVFSSLEKAIAKANELAIEDKKRAERVYKDMKVTIQMHDAQPIWDKDVVLSVYKKSPNKFIKLHFKVEQFEMD